MISHRLARIVGTIVVVWTLVGIVAAAFASRFFSRRKALTPTVDLGTRTIFGVDHEGLKSGVTTVYDELARLSDRSKHWPNPAPTFDLEQGRIVDDPATDSADALAKRQAESVLVTAREAAEVQRRADRIERKHGLEYGITVALGLITGDEEIERAGGYAGPWLAVDRQVLDELRRRLTARKAAVAS